MNYEVPFFVTMNNEVVKKMSQIKRAKSRTATGMNGTLHTNF